MTWGGPSILPSCSLSTDREWERKGFRSNRMIPEIEQTCQESGSYNSRVFEGQEAPLWLWGVWVCGEAGYPVTLSLPAMFGWHILLTGSLQGKRTMIRWSRRGFVADRSFRKFRKCTKNLPIILPPICSIDLWHLFPQSSQDWKLRRNKTNNQIAHNNLYTLFLASTNQLANSISDNF